MANEEPPLFIPDSTTADSIQVETITQREQRPSLKRKSDEDLGNDVKRTPESEENMAVEQERRVIIMKGSLPKLALPPGWIALNHRSGGIVYLHKPTRVCTWSRPYHIGGGSVRKHDVPIAAIPCLHQKRGLVQEHIEVEGSSSASILSNKGASILNALNMGEKSSDEDTTNDSGDTKQSSVITDEGHEKNGLDVVMSVADTSSLTDSNSVTTVDGVKMMNGLSETDDLLQNGCMTDADDVTQHSQVVEDSTHSGKDDKSGKETSSGYKKPVREGSVLSIPPLLDLIDSKELGSYLSNIWEFQPLTHDQEKNAVIFQPQVEDDLELPASLECQPYALKAPENAKQSGKDLMLNAGGKTPVAILHEYCQRALKTKPVYLTSECENADKPFMSEVQIDGIKYGSGTGSNKKLAKQIAAECTLEVLLPGVFKKVRDLQISEAELEFFDKVDIVDPRLHEFCSKTTLPNPSQILEECLRRNQGICPTPIHFSTMCGQHKNLFFKITCGKHEATGPCKNKRIGKQLASQQILKKLHPHLEKWGALLRIYCNRPTGAIKKYKKDDSDFISVKEVQSGTVQQNNSLLERLKEEMRKLYLQAKNETRQDVHSSPEPVFTVDI